MRDQLSVQKEVAILVMINEGSGREPGLDAQEES